MNREQVVAAAAEILSTQGASAFSMRTLAAKLDMSPMGIYHYFDSKNDLLGAVLEFQSWSSPAPELPDEPRARLVALGTAVVDHLTQHPWVIDVLAGQENVDARTAWVFDEFLRTCAALGIDDATADRAAQGVWRIALGEIVVRHNTADRDRRGVAPWYVADPLPQQTAGLDLLRERIAGIAQAAQQYDVRNTFTAYLGAVLPPA
ncbi:TetR/AcrR family transcriptional regulator [Tsukamurella sp. 8F]|uniref:TetR/AcrR family transcriptional regulator n=1 Tax=unclassified Tsukamurella TaxID=2633480 RepID=UPI0023B9203F|nr:MULTISPECIES: TetR/AcrR family transcriptional regulator [unclassified Tsukamurella]MDF0530820.1 TetR/AcrR family transcriptional regulator [Tsukamurella sp. 8J]MDF0589526.1 TetR/AcrR family transcriptional regulator [Tsukamurella sp. 8F]